VFITEGLGFTKCKAKETTYPHYTSQSTKQNNKAPPCTSFTCNDGSATIGVVVFMTQQGMLKKHLNKKRWKKVLWEG
jgi:hypothetical protein